METLDVVTFGETMVLFEPIQMYPLEYVHQFEKHIGGAESNVSIGLSRLGHSVGWFSKLGDDPFGRYVNQFIRGEGIDTSRCIFTNKAPTGLLFKEKKSAENVNVFYYRKNSAASMLGSDDLDEDYIKKAKVLHLTGITAALSDSCAEAIFKAIEIAKKHNVLIVFDPNVRLKLWSKEKAKDILLKMVNLADVILPGISEGQLMTGKTTPEEIATSLDPKGTKKVVIKLGSDGAFYQTYSESGYIEGFPVKQVIDPVGAGDAFAAGIISGILRQETMSNVVRRANAIGAIAVGFPGDVEGLPRSEDVERLLNIGSNNIDVDR